MIRFKALTIGWILLGAHADTGMPSEPEDAPSKYVLDYPAADRFCPPIRSTFVEVTCTFLVVRGHRFWQQPNGGYGLPMAHKVDKKHLLHVGADLGMTTLFRLHVDDKAAPVTLAALGEENIRIEAPNPVPEGLQIDGTAYPITRRDDQYFLPSHVLYKLPHRPIVGYDLATEGWYDPIAFLVQHRAEAAPAPFLPLSDKRRR